MICSITGLIQKSVGVAGLATTRAEAVMATASKTDAEKCSIASFAGLNDR
jgi:hypothetical protein